MANEKRLIDANEIVKVAEHAYKEWNLAMAAADGQRQINLVYKMKELCKAVKAVAAAAPTVDAVEVVHGRWIEKVDMVESYLADCTEVFYECSVCECANIGESPYCPNCGAKMDGGNEDG